MSLYMSNSSLILAIRSGSQPGMIVPLVSPAMDSNMFSGSIASTVSWLYARTVVPSSLTLASSVLVQSNTGMKL